jgi:hypothetical protein
VSAEKPTGWALRLIPFSVSSNGYDDTTGEPARRRTITGLVGRICSISIASGTIEGKMSEAKRARVTEWAFFGS